MSPFYRLYHHFDSWYIDTGDPSDHKEFNEVILSCPASTNRDKNKSWLEVYDATLREEDGIGYLEQDLEKEA